MALVTPGYPAYRNTLRAMGLVPVELRCGREHGFRPTAAMIESLDPALAALDARAEDIDHLAVEGQRVLVVGVDGCGGTAVVAQPSTAETIGYGSTAAPPAGCTSKCRCAVPALPLLPIVPMICPAVTTEPTVSPLAKESRWA